MIYTSEKGCIDTYSLNVLTTHSATLADEREGTGSPVSCTQETLTGTTLLETQIFGFRTETRD